MKHAATFFNDEDAQFELAKLYLTGEGIAPDPAQALHYLSVLTTERKHPGAQAFLADLYWRGGPVRRDPLTALALIAVAVENAPEFGTGLDRRHLPEHLLQRVGGRPSPG